jgi:pyruvate dehydrogenase E1 component alpha subunit
MDAEVREEVDHSVKFAEESPLPAPEELYTDIYSNPIVPGAGK